MRCLDDQQVLDYVGRRAAPADVAEIQEHLDGCADCLSGFGGFARAGYQLAAGGSHALYVSGEVQVGDVADRARAVALFAFGYQYL